MDDDKVSAEINLVCPVVKTNSGNSSYPVVTNMVVSSDCFKSLGSWGVWIRGELEGLFCCGLIWVALVFRLYGCV